MAPECPSYGYGHTIFFKGSLGFGGYSLQPRVQGCILIRSKEDFLLPVGVNLLVNGVCVLKWTGELCAVCSLPSPC